MKIDSSNKDNARSALKQLSSEREHQEDKLSKTTISLLPIKKIAILERTQSNVQQNIEQLQTPTMGVTINIALVIFVLELSSKQQKYTRSRRE